jgi:hypothetical protein
MVRRYGRRTAVAWKPPTRLVTDPLRGVRSVIGGKGVLMEKTVDVRDVKERQSQSGNTRWVLVDEDGNEYTTFRPEIGRRAREADGKRARIEFHEDEKRGYRNVYLDAVEPQEKAQTDGADSPEADEVAWKTAIEAAPWLLGGTAPEREVPADELFEKLKPFKDLVEHDIEDEEVETRG